MFVAVQPPEEAAEHLDAFLEPRRDHAAFRWTLPEQLHLTLAFLEEVPDRSLDALVEGLRRFGHRRALPLESPAALADLIGREAAPGDLVVCLGAGDITAWAGALPAQLEALAR